MRKIDSASFPFQANRLIGQNVQMSRSLLEITDYTLRRNSRQVIVQCKD